jgi:hypothetical protein
VKISTALLLAIAPFVSSAHATDDTVISALRTCIQENAPAAQSAGVQADEAIAFFGRRCERSLLIALAAKPDVGPVAPGHFRLVIREEWAAFTAHAGKD